jgi:formiminoglutamase
VGFPQDEGVRRNGGRVGAALAPEEIRRWLYRLTTWHVPEQIDLSRLSIIDIGNLEVASDLEASQDALGEVVAELLVRDCTPIVLGGGHETAYGTYLGYMRAKQAISIINVDAHLDVRPLIDGQGHSGSPFRQAMEHPSCPLPGHHYICIGAQPFSNSQEHATYVKERGGYIRWCDPVNLTRCFDHLQGPLHLSVDADVVRAADVPGVSAPNPIGLPGEEIAYLGMYAGRLPRLRSMELVEINPRFDIDGRSARWGSVLIWNFLVGLALRRTTESRS